MPIIEISGSVGRNGLNRPEDARKIKRRLIDLGFNWIEPDASIGPTTVSVIQLFQAIKNGLQVVDAPQNDGRVDPGGSTLAWLNAGNAPRWKLMPAGSEAEGYVNVERANESDNHDFGCSWLAETLAAAGAAYRATYLSSHPRASLIFVNDTSVPMGGRTPDHATHQTGLCCDLLVPRKDGRATGGITFLDAKYDRGAARAILFALRTQRLAQRILFNDPMLIEEGLCRAMTGHDNHLHFEILPPSLPTAPRALRAAERGSRSPRARRRVR